MRFKIAQNSQRLAHDDSAYMKYKVFDICTAENPHSFPKAPQGYMKVLE